MAFVHYVPILCARCSVETALAVQARLSLETRNVAISKVVRFSPESSAFIVLDSPRPVGCWGGRGGLREVQDGWPHGCLALQVKGRFAGRPRRPGAALQLVVSLLLQSHQESGTPVSTAGLAAATVGGMRDTVGGQLWVTQGGENRGRKTVETGGGPGSTSFLSPGLGHVLPKVLPADKWASDSPFLLPPSPTPPILLQPLGTLSSPTQARPVALGRAWTSWGHISRQAGSTQAREESGPRPQTALETRLCGVSEILGGRDFS